MKPHYKLLILLLLPAFLAANNGKPKGIYTKEKTISKEFKVNSDALLKIENSYGNIDIATWNENRTVIEVRIRTIGDDESKVIQKLKEITVDFSASGSLVYAKTVFSSSKNVFSWWGNNNNVSMEINYTIKIPVTNSVNLDNDYGTISIKKLTGNAKISCDYGQLIIGELRGKSNILSFDYTNNSTIGYMKSGKIYADYSGFTLEKAENIEVFADYTNSEIVDAGSLIYKCDYGKITVRKINNLNGEGNYLTTRVGTVSGSVQIQSGYGSVDIARLTANAKSVTINSNYTSVKMGFEKEYHFNFKVNIGYSSLKGKENVTVTKATEAGSTNIYEGYNGKPNSGNQVHINSNFGGVTFTEL